jgi:hypothetical protein
MLRESRNLPPARLKIERSTRGDIELLFFTNMSPLLYAYLPQLGIILHGSKNKMSSSSCNREVDEVAGAARAQARLLYLNKMHEALPATVSMLVPAVGMWCLSAFLRRRQSVNATHSVGDDIPGLCMLYPLPTPKDSVLASWGSAHCLTPVPRTSGVAHAGSGPHPRPSVASYPPPCPK